MKDPRDTQTAELIPTPRKRGRPSTGNALTGAQRQAKYRESQAEKTVTVTINRDDLDTLKLALLMLEQAGCDNQESLDRVTHAVYGSQWSSSLHARASTNRMKARAKEWGR